jgi:hypothetical protein
VKLPDGPYVDSGSGVEDLERVYREPGQRLWRAKIYSMRSDGTHVRLLTRTRSNNESPVWSPDGSSIAFERSPLRTDRPVRG